MKPNKKVLLLPILGLLLLCQSAAAQIIDDTTRLLYSPKTTLQLYEQQILRGNYEEVAVDTLLHNLHNERYWYNDTAFYQHLGNIGTAAQPLLFRMPDQIGVRLGKNIFDRYAYNPGKLNYFNTRSPYTHLYYVQGSRGEQAFEALHTRNITSRWNAGIAYQVLSANQQIGQAATERRTRGFIDNQAVKAFTHYRSENDKYDAFFNFTYMKVEQIETGGILPDTSLATTRNNYAESILARFAEAPVQMTQTSNEEGRTNFHFLQIYKLAKENLKVYHQLDWYRQRNVFEDENLSIYRRNITPFAPKLDRTFVVYPNFDDVVSGYNFTPARTKESTTFRSLQNVFGLTGNNKLSSYNAYAKLRNVNMQYAALVPLVKEPGETDTTTRYGDFRQTDTYAKVLIGGDIRLFYKNLAELTGEAEYQLGSDYRVKGKARIGGASATLERVLLSPTLVENDILSNHYAWENDFEPSVTDRIGVGFESHIGKRQFLRLDAHYTNVKRYIFFNERAIPQQLSGNQRFFGASLSHHIQFGVLHFKNFGSYTNTDEADKIRVPEFLMESSLYLEGYLFKKALFSQVGVQATYPSSYYADGYMPVTQQFYVQNSFLVQSYPVVEVFMNADIKSVNLFLKMAHVNDGLLDPVYFNTPYYPAMRRSFVFGLKWMFFD
ncbi:putative porin [Pontibacter sp. CAU 1760]